MLALKQSAGGGRPTAQSPPPLATALCYIASEVATLRVNGFGNRETMRVR